VRNYDIYPTLLDCLGLAAKVPQTPPPPGRSFAPALKGEPTAWDNVAFYEFDTTRAIRTGEWKYVRRPPTGPDELYDLKRDPGERVNLIDRPAQAAVRAELGKRLDEFFAKYADPKYDLLHGGKSKAKRIGGEP
jgi:arylsulfatase A-like enzyme